MDPPNYCDFILVSQAVGEGDDDDELESDEVDEEMDRISAASPLLAEYFNTAKLKPPVPGHDAGEGLSKRHPHLLEVREEPAEKWRSFHARACPLDWWVALDATLDDLGRTGLNFGKWTALLHIMHSLALRSPHGTLLSPKQSMTNCSQVKFVENPC